MQVPFDAFGRGQLAQNLELFVILEPRMLDPGLETTLDPALLLGIGDVHVLGADRARVHVLADIDDVAQLHLVVVGVERAGVENLVHVRLAETVIGRIEIGQRRRLIQTQRVEIGDAMPPAAVVIDQLEHAGLLLGGTRGQPGFGRSPLSCRSLHVHERVADRTVGDIAATAVTVQALEVVAPARLDSIPDRGDIARNRLRRRRSCRRTTGRY